MTRGRAPVADDAGDRAVRAMVEADTASRLLGIEVVALEPGHVTMRMTVLPSMIKGHGTCHGGYLTFIAPVRAGDILEAEALQRLSFGRSGLFDVTVRRTDGTVVVEFRGHSRRLSAPP